nr:hypothetical protein [Tanacetum cinerariifolium]
MSVHIIIKDTSAMDITIDQQVALDEALVPHASRLKIGKSNFRLRSDITSKEFTLQLVYDVLRLTLFYKAFLVTADVPEIYMEMLHICPRLPGQTFDELPFEEEILAFLIFLRHIEEIRKLTDVNINKLHQPWRSFAAVINKFLSGKSTGYDRLWEDFVYQVEHKDAKKSNEMYYPRFIKVIIHYFMTKDPSIPRRNKATSFVLAFAVIVRCSLGTRLLTSVKGKQPAKASKAKGLNVLSEVAMTEVEQMKFATKRSLQQTYISQASGSSVDEGIGIISGVLNVLTDDSDEEISWKSSDEDDDDEVDERSDGQDDDDLDDDDKDDNDNDQDTDNDGDDFDDEGNNDASLGLNVGIEEGKDAEDDDDELYRDVNINLGRDSSSVSSQFVTSMLSLSPDAGIDFLFKTTPRVDVQASTTDLLNFGSLFRFDHRLKTLEANFSEYVQTNQFVGAVSSIIGIVERYMDQQMNEAVKTTSESAPTEEPMQITQDLKEPSHQEFETGVADDQPIAEAFYDLAKQADSRSLFNELMDTPVDFLAYLMNRLKVDTLTPKLLGGPMYELMKGSCKSLVELKFFLEEVYKATTDQLDWNNLEGQRYPHNMLNPLPLIPNSQGRHVIPFDHFINNYLEYLCGDASSRKYTTSVTKTKAADYGHIMWIEDLVPRTMWSQEPVSYDKYALWEISHWGHKRQQIYGFAVNREFAQDIYSKHRIIAVTKL